MCLFISRSGNLFILHKFTKFTKVTTVHPRISLVTVHFQTILYIVLFCFIIILLW